MLLLPGCCGYQYPGAQASQWAGAMVDHQHRRACRWVNNDGRQLLANGKASPLRYQGHQRTARGRLTGSAELWQHAVRHAGWPWWGGGHVVHRAARVWPAPGRSSSPWKDIVISPGHLGPAATRCRCPEGGLLLLGMPPSKIGWWPGRGPGGVWRAGLRRPYNSPSIRAGCARPRDGRAPLSSAV